jgi:hypothetical protein
MYKLISSIRPKNSFGQLFKSPFRSVQRNNHNNTTITKKSVLFRGYCYGMVTTGTILFLSNLYHGHLIYHETRGKRHIIDYFNLGTLIGLYYGFGKAIIYGPFWFPCLIYCGIMHFETRKRIRVNGYWLHTNHIMTHLIPENMETIDQLIRNTMCYGLNVSRRRIALYKKYGILTD